MVAWCFIDYENVHSLEGINFSEWDKLVIFIGAKQTRLELGNLPINNTVNIELIKVAEVSPNNLDFHLVWHLGNLHQQVSKDIAFTIISGDNGYGPLTRTINSTGRNCKLINPVVGLLKTSSASVSPLVDEKLLKSLLGKEAKLRPQKVASLKNHIAAHMKIQGDETAIQRHLNQLKQANIIAVEGMKVIYKGRNKEVSAALKGK